MAKWNGLELFKRRGSEATIRACRTLYGSYGIVNDANPPMALTLTYVT